MDEDRKSDLMAAATTLVRSPNAHRLYEILTKASPLMGQYVEVCLVGEADTLNTLARLKATNVAVFNSIMELVDRKRAAAGYDPLNEPNKFDKTDYMREFMGEKRLRERRAANIENLLRSPRDQLKGRSRLDFMQRQSAIWKKERDTLIERAKASSGGTTLRREDLVFLLDSFWAKIDKQLDEMEDHARNESVGIKGPKVSLDELDAALRHDPYKV